MDIDAELLAQRLSYDRLAPYLDACDGDLVRAIRLYEWNAAVSGALFEVLADVEVILRNAIHTSMTAWSIRKGHGPNWFDNAHGLLDERANRDIAKARVRVGRVGDQPTPDRLVSEFSFGFWRFLLTKKYESSLWASGLREGFPNSPLSLAEHLFRRVGRLHALRNRIAHHESVFGRRLDLDLNDAYMAIRCVCHEAEQWARRRSRVEPLIEIRPE